MLDLDFIAKSADPVKKDLMELSLSIAQLDYEMAEDLPFKTICMIEHTCRILENQIKGYINAVTRDKKNGRIKCMKTIKSASKEVEALLKNFKKKWQENEEKKKSECSDCESE